MTRLTRTVGTQAQAQKTSQRQREPIEAEYVC